MSSLDKFGSKWSEGKNLEVLSELQSWFEKSKDVNIVRYFSIFDPTSRNKFWLSKEDYKKCEVCGRDLSLVESKIFEEGEYVSTKNVKVKQKRQLVAIDSTGEAHHTCFKLKRCLKEVGFSPKSQRFPRRVVPSLRELLDIDPDEDVNPVFWDSISRDYEVNVKPFIFKWMNRDINKSNVSEFMRDLYKFKSHLVFYDERGGDILVSKVLTVIGVH